MKKNFKMVGVPPNAVEVPPPKGDLMGYSVGDRVEVKPKGKTRKMVNGVLTPQTWTVWLMEIVSMKPHMYNMVWPKEGDHVWKVKFTRVSHSSLIQESWIVKKISSNFKGFKSNKSVQQL